MKIKMAELSSVDVHYIVKELQLLAGSRLQNIYQPDKEHLILQLFKTGSEKTFLNIKSGLIFTANVKDKQPIRPSNFCAQLRNTLENGKLQIIKQISGERIIEFSITVHDKTFLLIAELFGKNNIILLNDKNLILAVSHIELMSSRSVKQGAQYLLPSKRDNIESISLKEFSTIISNSSIPISKLLATAFGLGGTYAKEICLRTNIDFKAVQIKNFEEIFLSCKSLFSQVIDARIILEDNNILAITPFSLKIFEDKHFEKFSTFSEAIATASLKIEVQQQSTEFLQDKSAVKIERLKNNIADQEHRILEFEKKHNDAQFIGNLIYEKYSDFNHLLKSSQKLAEEKGWNAVKEALLKNKRIKNVDLKEKKVIIEI